MPAGPPYAHRAPAYGARICVCSQVTVVSSPGHAGTGCAASWKALFSSAIVDVLPSYDVSLRARGGKRSGFVRREQ